MHVHKDVCSGALIIINRYITQTNLNRYIASFYFQWFIVQTVFEGAIINYDIDYCSASILF